MNNWEDERAELGRVAKKLLQRIDEYLDKNAEVDLKDIKALTGALKELQSLWEEKEDVRGGALTVRFQGEAEEMSL